MATIACPECGLPREENQVGTVPCPVCDSEPTPTPERRSAAKPTPPDPTAGLATDASELDKLTAARRPLVSSLWLAIPVTFLLGAATGVGGVLGWQAAFTPEEQAKDTRSEFASVDPSNSTLPALPPRAPEIAPMPHEPKARESIPETKIVTGSEVKKVPPLPPPARAMVIDLNQPDATYRVPVTMNKGEHVILRGKVKILRLVGGLDGGAVLDASGLEVSSIFVTGKIDGRSTLKLNSPNGFVTIMGQVTGNSHVEITTATGTVQFALPDGHDGQGSQIDGGAQVTLTARNADVRGEMNGVETKLSGTFPPGGAMRLSAVRGTATVEYRVDGRGTATVVVGTLSPTATLRKVE